MLKWANWSSHHNSWQDEQYQNCPDLIRKYEDNAIKKVAKKKGKRVKKPNKKKTIDLETRKSDSDIAMTEMAAEILGTYFVN